MAFKPPRAGGLFAARETSTPMMKPPATTFSAGRTPQGPDTTSYPKGWGWSSNNRAWRSFRFEVGARETGAGACRRQGGHELGKWQEGVAFSQHAHAQASRARMRERMCTHMCALALSCSVVHPCVLDPVLPSTWMPPDVCAALVLPGLRFLCRVSSSRAGAIFGVILRSARPRTCSHQYIT